MNSAAIIVRAKAATLGPWHAKHLRPENCIETAVMGVTLYVRISAHRQPGLGPRWHPERWRDPGGCKG